TRPCRSLHPSRFTPFPLVLRLAPRILVFGALSRRPLSERCLHAALFHRRRARSRRQQNDHRTCHLRAFRCLGRGGVAAAPGSPSANRLDQEGSMSIASGSAAKASPNPRRYFEHVDEERGAIAAAEPVCLYLETTNRCNLLCTTCPRTFETLEP